MSSTAVSTDASSRPPPHLPALAPVPAPIDRVALRAELDALNLELRELRSMDHGVRAYFELWGGFAATTIAGKLIYDSAKIAWFAWPLLALGLLLLLDAASHKLTQRRIAQDESRRLARQRALRIQLGLDEITLPAQTARPAADA